MSMLNRCDSTPDDPVIDATAEMLVLKELDLQEFPDTNTKGGFQHGYMVGFKAGVEFIRAFYRRREMLSKLRDYEHKKKTNKVAEIDESDDRQIKPVPGTMPPVKVLTWPRPPYPEPFPGWVNDLVKRKILEVTGNTDEVMILNTTKSGQVLLHVGEFLVYVTDGIGEFILKSPSVTPEYLSAWRRLPLRPSVLPIRDLPTDSNVDQVKRSPNCDITPCSESKLGGGLVERAEKLLGD